MERERERERERGRELEREIENISIHATVGDGTSTTK